MTVTAYFTIDFTFKEKAIQLKLEIRIRIIVRTKNMTIHIHGFHVPKAIVLHIIIAKF